MTMAGGLNTERLLGWRLPSPGNTMLGLCALFNITLLAILLLTLLGIKPAHAQEDLSCVGQDLVEIMQRDEPQKYQNLQAEADKVLNGKGTFWRIEKDGLAPSYLLGTMHVTDPRVLKMPKGAQEAFASAKTVVVESDEILDEQKAAVAIFARPDLSMFIDGKSITDMLSTQDKQRLEDDLKQRGIPLVSVLKMKPWILASFVALPACEFKRKAQGASFLDKKIAEDGVASGKSIKGLETLVEQIQAMADLPMDFHMKALVETLSLGDRMQDIMWTMTDLYLQENVGAIMPMVTAVTPESSDADEDGYASFEKRIITDRNHVMAERAAPLLAQGSVFIAVGALHLPDEEGVIELLRKQGYTLTRVN